MTSTPRLFPYLRTLTAQGRVVEVSNRGRQVSTCGGSNTLHAVESLVGHVKPFWTNSNANDGIETLGALSAADKALVAEAEAIMNAPELAVA